MGFDLNNLAYCAMCVLDTGLIVVLDFKRKRIKNKNSSSLIHCNLPGAWVQHCCQKRNISNTLLQHVEIVECFVKTKLFDRHFESPVSPTLVPASGEWSSSVQSRSKLRKCCGGCRNVPTMQLTLRLAGLLTNKCDFINKHTFRHHNKLTQLDWLDSVKYLQLVI